MLFTKIVFGSGYLCYHYRKKIWNKIKNLPKKKLIFGASCIGFLYYRNKNKSWGPVLRPKKYDELVSLKRSGLNCFYCYKGIFSYIPDKDYTASVVGQIVAENYLNIESMSSTQIEEICTNLINEKKKQGKHVNNFIYEEVYYEKGDIAISINEFRERTKLITGKGFNYSDKERIQKYNKIPYEELISGRVFDKKIPFYKILDFVDFALEHKEQFKSLCEFILKKEIDTEILKYFFNDNNKKDDALKKAFAMDLLYGVFSDTCCLGGFILIDTNYLKSECNGCEFHTKQEKTYGAMTFLEHIIAYNKKKREFNIFKDKLVELEIINK